MSVPGDGGVGCPQPTGEGALPFLPVRTAARPVEVSIVGTVTGPVRDSPDRGPGEESGGGGRKGCAGASRRRHPVARTAAARNRGHASSLAAHRPVEHGGPAEDAVGAEGRCASAAPAGVAAGLPTG